jgi:hypothetical protein
MPNFKKHYRKSIKYHKKIRILKWNLIYIKVIVSKINNLIKKVLKVQLKIVY